MLPTRRFLEVPPSSALLLGPRGTGKSTWLRQALPDALRVDLLDPVTQRELLARPERLVERLGASSARDVVIDEIQKVPALLDVVHAVLESRPGMRFVLTGSSARTLRRGAANLLGGRLLDVSMHPFMAAELGDDFSLERALTRGLVPLVVAAAAPDKTLRSYASLYVHQEVKAEAMVRDVGSFARFLEVMSFSHGAALNLAAIARECEVSRKAVEGYLGSLEDLLLSFRVPVFTKRARRQLMHHDKFYYFDTGIFRSLRPRGPLDRPEEIEGAALEGLVAQHLRAYLAYGHKDASLSYWRTRSGVEVDFVVYGDDVFAAFEVKRAIRIESQDVRALRSFREDYPEASVTLLHLGAESRVVDGVPCRPVEAFLRDLRPNGPL